MTEFATSTTPLLAQITEQLNTGALEAEVASKLGLPRELVAIAARELVRLGVADAGSISSRTSASATTASETTASETTASEAAQCSSCPAERMRSSSGKIRVFSLPLACAGCPFAQPITPARN